MNVKNKNRFLYRFVKRLLDIELSVLGLVILFPFLLIFGLIVRLTSEGPALYIATRVGYHHKMIKVVKFRTMVKDAEKLIDQLDEDQRREFYENYKLDNDPRITRVGKWYRKTSIDELPQLINILKGDLSIVGPRPVTPDEIVNNYGEYADKLLSVKPGLTGYWQTHGRSDVSYAERIQLDMYYIDHASLWLDTKIFFQTFSVVLLRKGAR